MERFSITKNGNVGIGTTSPGTTLDINGYIARKIWRVHGNGPSDGTDTGYVSGRSLTITKYKANTSLRVGYSDNLRTHAANASCRWEIYIDGSSCSSGGLTMDVYTAGSNVHHQRAYFGYCDTVSSGSHTLTVYVSSTPGYSGVDCFTGWPDQSWALEAEEIN